MFPLDLSRRLAGWGHEVLHLHCADVETPRGRLERGPGDPPGFASEPVTIGRILPKYDLARRWMLERTYGGILTRRILAFNPDVVLSGNTPPAAQAGPARVLARAGVPLVVWVQDLFTPGVERATRNWPAPARALARTLVARTEFGAMRRAAALVVISPDFPAEIERHGLRHPHVAVIENWAPLGEIVPRPKDNPWSRRHGLADRFVFLCSGTLGLKHNPDRLAELALAFRDDHEVRVVVVSQGLGRRRLEELKAERGIDNLVLLDFQSHADVSDMLAAADVAVALLEPFAGVLSVPSRVYSHFRAERSLLGAIPAANLARRLIEREGAGLCVDPDDAEGFIAAARRLRADETLRAAHARAQSAHAATAFDIDRVGRRFEEVLREASRARRGGLG